MSNIAIKLENIKLHNKLNTEMEKKLELTENSKKLIKEYKECLQKYELELKRLREENSDLRIKYQSIPKFIRNIFEFLRIK